MKHIKRDHELSKLEREIEIIMNSKDKIESENKGLVPYFVKDMIEELERKGFREGHIKHVLSTYYQVNDHVQAI